MGVLIDMLPVKHFSYFSKQFYTKLYKQMATAAVMEFIKIPNDS